MPLKANLKDSDLKIFQILPNLMTLGAICAGITAIRFGIRGDLLIAVQLIMAAAILDGLDGRVARALGSDSLVGAELDSLADFLNFGVAPPMILYYWALEDLRSAAWLVVLVFAMCCVLRLARFNVDSKSETEEDEKPYFEGVPAPAGAMLVLLPVYIHFAFDQAPQIPGTALCAYMVLIGLLMISKIPTWSFKSIKIKREAAKFVLVACALAGAAFLTFPWITLICISLSYAGLVIWSLFHFKSG